MSPETINTLLATRFYVPPLREDAVPRPRLTERLLEGARRPGALALLSGPAGFGKSSLLAEFATRAGWPLAWLSLDEGDNDPARFWAYLFAAIARSAPALGPAAGAAQALLGAPAPLPPEAIPTLLINALAAQGTPGVKAPPLALILDDLHAVANPEIHTGLIFLLEHPPEILYLLAATRVDPPWPLARWRARNRLVELRAADLRFTPDEASRFLLQTAGINLSEHEARTLEQRVEGWPAGLQLAAAALHGRGDPAEFLRAFSGSHAYVAEYLLEEALLHATPEVQDFLLQTAVLEGLNADLCRAVTGNENSGELLAHLRRANLFVLPLDAAGNWFRYHALFADLLRARLRQQHPADHIADLHRRAAAWYMHENLPDEAIRHALASGDIELAVQLIEAVALPMILRAHVRTVEGWLNALPAPALAAAPRLNMIAAWLRLLQNRPQVGEVFMQRLEDHFAAQGSNAANTGAAISAGAENLLRTEWLALRAKQALLLGQPEEARMLGEQALKALGAAPSPLRSLIVLNLATASAQMLDYAAAAEQFAAVAAEGRANGDFVSETLGVSAQAQMLLVQGQLNRAGELASEVVERLEAAGQVTPFAATLYGELGQVCFYRGQFDAAQAHFRRSAEISRRSGFSDSEIYLQVVASRVAQIRGDWPAAAQAIDTAAGLARHAPPAMVREEIIAQQARVAVSLGQLGQAEALLAEAGVPESAEKLSAAGAELRAGDRLPPVDHPSGLLLNALLRLRLAQAQAGESPAVLRTAVDLAGHVLDGELACRCLPAALETLLLRSRLHAAAGDNRPSQEDLIRALALAGPAGIVSPFPEAGPEIATGIQSLLRRGRLPATAPGFAETVLAAFPAGASQMPSARAASIYDDDADEDTVIMPLTRRELEVLRMIAAGLSNAEIANRLVITVSAVKKHTANIYNRLNVGSRTQAVARAHRLGLLSEE